MCGIFGYFSKGENTLDHDVLLRMGNMIRHRGPDDSGLFEGQGVALGNLRLSIMDVEGGHQPFISDDGAIVVVQNGEIFNHVELAEELKSTDYECRSHCDTEVILRLYEREGLEFVSRLNGMFAIAIYDRRQQAVFLIRDRIGVKPLYIYEDDQFLIFASEIKSLLQAGITREMDYEALSHFLTYNYVPEPWTMFEGIRHLSPGTLLSIDSNECTQTRWWDLADFQVEERTEDEWINAFNEVLKDAVRLRLRSDVPFGAFLSGGVDSSSVVGLMSQELNEPVKTFSIGFHEERFDESPFAAMAAERFKTDHTLRKVAPNMLENWPKAVWFCDQPHGDISFLPTLKVSELAAEKVTVVLTGDGADELFAGYDKYKGFFAEEQRSGESEGDYRSAYYQQLSLFTDQEKSELLSSVISTKLESRSSFNVIEPLFDKTAHMDNINRALYIDSCLLLSGNNLVKPDRMGMAVSIEARAPFLDYRMMELAFKMPGQLKLKDGETKYLYKKAVKDLIGEDLAYRKKQMFTVPVGEWFKQELAEFTNNLLLGERFLSRQLFNQEYVSSLLADHQSGISNNTREIRALIAVEIWCRVFLDSDFDSPPSWEDLGLSEIFPCEMTA